MYSCQVFIRIGIAFAVDDCITNSGNINFEIEISGDAEETSVKFKIKQMELLLIIRDKIKILI